jgi:hypothetical protein
MRFFQEWAKSPFLLIKIQSDNSAFNAFLFKFVNYLWISRFNLAGRSVEIKGHSTIQPSAISLIFFWVRFVCFSAIG